jgi:hypothetical protein
MYEERTSKRVTCIPGHFERAILARLAAYEDWRDIVRVKLKMSTTEIILPSPVLHFHRPATFPAHPAYPIPHTLVVTPTPTCA